MIKPKEFERQNKWVDLYFTYAIIYFFCKKFRSVANTIKIWVNFRKLMNTYANYANSLCPLIVI